MWRGWPAWKIHTGIVGACPGACTWGAGPRSTQHHPLGHLTLPAPFAVEIITLGGKVMDTGASCTNTKSETLRPSISELPLLFPPGMDTVHQRGSFLSFLFSPILLCLHPWPLLRCPLSLYSPSWLHLMLILIT